MELKEFMANLAVDPVRLAEFIDDPEGVMESAGLTDDDKRAVTSRIPAVVAARLAGLPTKEAFQTAGFQPSEQTEFKPSLPSDAGCSWAWPSPLVISPSLTPTTVIPPVTPPPQVAAPGYWQWHPWQ